MSLTCTGHAFLNSGRTSIVTVIVRVNDPYDGEKYYFLGIKDWSDEETDIKQCVQWGSTLDPKVGRSIIDNLGSTKHIKYKGNNINLRR